MSELFPGLPKIPFEGPASDNPLAFKRYEADRAEEGQAAKARLRFAMAFHQAMGAVGSDPFGDPTAPRPWSSVSDPMEAARKRMRGILELAEKLSIPYFCFCDRDIAPEAPTIRETNGRLDEIASLAKELMRSNPTRLLWAEADLSGHARFMHGASTSPEPKVFAYAAAQVKKALEVAKELGALNFLFRGGREGYETLLNTDTRMERENMARFMRMAVDYAGEIGFTGQFLIEPKPREPMKHLYGFDAATCHAFLEEFDLLPYFKLKLGASRSALAGHTIQHELRFARDRGILGSVDANQGDELLGWDTERFPADLQVAAMTMYEVRKNGGLGSGGLAFDARLRRGSRKAEDLAVAHIAGMDLFACGDSIASRLIDDRIIDRLLDERYEGWREGLGASIRGGRENFERLEASMLDAPTAKASDFGLPSGKQEYLESIVNGYLH